MGGGIRGLGGVALEMRTCTHTKNQYCYPEEIKQTQSSSNLLYGRPEIMESACNEQPYPKDKF